MQAAHAPIPVATLAALNSYVRFHVHACMQADNVSTLVATLAALNSVGSPDIPQAVVVESSRGLADWNETPAGNVYTNVNMYVTV